MAKIPLKLIAVINLSFLSFIISPTQANSPSYLSAIERGIVAETNKVRANPRSYLELLEKWKKQFKGKQVYIGNRTYLNTQEGIKPVNEAIQVLKKTAPVSTLSPSKGMSLAAKDHVRDQGKTGQTGHNSSNGSTPSERLNRYGRWQRAMGENISYGPDTAQQVVMQLIIDDGVLDRGHRSNIFNPAWRVIGVACGPHPKFRIVCVMDYASGYQEK